MVLSESPLSQAYSVIRQSLECACKLIALKFEGDATSVQSCAGFECQNEGPPHRLIHLGLGYSETNRRESRDEINGEPREENKYVTHSINPCFSTGPVIGQGIKRSEQARAAADQLGAISTSDYHLSRA